MAPQKGKDVAKMKPLVLAVTLAAGAALIRLTPTLLGLFDNLMN